MAYPKPRGGSNGQAGYPMVRLVALVACGTRQVIDAVFGPDTIGEQTYAPHLTRCLHSGMVLLADRNFASTGFFQAITATGADFCIRAKTGRTALRMPVLTRLPDGSYLSRAGMLPVRVIDATVHLHTEAGTTTGTYRLVTSLLDWHEAPARQLVDLYHARWEIETSFCELKSTILDERVLRAKHPAGVEQEVWATLCAYQALRITMTDAIGYDNDIPADRLSFKTALLEARDQIIRTDQHIQAATITLTGRIGTAVLADIQPPRRTRTRTRAVKRALSRYPAKGRNVDRRTYPATLHTRILTEPISP